VPFEFNDEDAEAICTACHAAGTGCLIDTRVNRIKGRETNFQVIQQRLMDCAFEDFVPGSANDPDPSRESLRYRQQATDNVLRAGQINFGADFKASKQQLAKVDGDVYELMEAAALWNAAAAWNVYMDTGVWTSTEFTCPASAVPTPTRKVAIVKMARGADTTKLLSPAARGEYAAFETALQKQGMELRLSTPDILGVRIPDPMPPGYGKFMNGVSDLSRTSQEHLETAWQGIQGSIEGRHFLFAIAVKTSTRSDRLYQALFEANVLKFIIGYVLRGPAIKFHAHLESFAGSDVVGRYNAAAMTSLLAGGTLTRAIDVLYQARSPRDTAQMILDSLPDYPL
jgi:hypothetical protein